MITYIAAATCKHTFFFFPSWWEFLKAEPYPQCFSFTFPGDILPVSLAIVDMILRVAGLVAIVSIIYAGVMYMTAGGQFEKTAAAKTRIYNSLAGLAIVAVAAGVVAFIGKTLA